MTIIVGFISQKGGVGKSTLSRALAIEAASEGLDTKVADLDIQQATTTNWLRRRMQSNFPMKHLSVESFKTAKNALSRSDKYDLFIIDGPARSSEASLMIAQSADLVVQPTGASSDDLEPAILKFHELVKKGIPKSKLKIALCRIGTESEEQACREYISEAGYDVLDGCLYEKPAYRQAQNLGRSVTETSYKKMNEKSEKLVQSIVDLL